MQGMCQWQLPLCAAGGRTRACMRQLPPCSREPQPTMPTNTNALVPGCQVQAAALRIPAALGIGSKRVRVCVWREAGWSGGGGVGVKGRWGSQQHWVAASANTGTLCTHARMHGLAAWPPRAALLSTHLGQRFRGRNRCGSACGWSSTGLGTHPRCGAGGHVQGEVGCGGPGCLPCGHARRRYGVRQANASRTTLVIVVPTESLAPMRPPPQARPTNLLEGRGHGNIQLAVGPQAKEAVGVACLLWQH